MNVLLIFLIGTLMGAFNLGFFLLGYYLRDKKPAEDSVTVTKENEKFLKELMEWKNFGGNK